MRYVHNYLTKVILRLDFPALTVLAGDKKPALSVEIGDQFPVVIGRQMAQINFSVTNTGAGVEREIKGWNWEHRNKEGGGKLVSLSQNYLSLEFDKGEFDYFPPFEETFEFVFTRFQKLYKLSEFSRVGLRYINVIKISEGNALNWDNLIDDSLVTGVKAGLGAGMKLTRSMHQLHARKDDISILFQYGIFNPDFPETVARREFVLDYDCFISEGIPQLGVIDRIKELNTIAEQMFEGSIRDGLRTKMEVINE